MGDLQDYIAARPGSSATVALTAAALKSLFAFAQEVGYLRFNIGAAVKVPPIKNTLAERIMAEADALLMIRQEPSLRNRVLLTVLYGGGLRISEVCGLRWRDLMARDEAGQATVFGNGGKTRAVLLSAATWKVLTALRSDAPAVAPVFLSRKGGALDPSAVHRVVKAAAARAGLPGEVSARAVSTSAASRYRTQAAIHRVSLRHGERPMPDEPKTANTQDLADTEYDAERWARVGAEQRPLPPISPKAPSDPAEGPDVGLSQKGTDEDAIVKRETEV